MKRNPIASFEEAMMLLKRYRKRRIERARYEAMRIAEKRGAVHSRSLRVRLKKIAPWLLDGEDERWMGAVFNARVWEYVEDYFPPEASPNTRPGGVGGRSVRVWRLKTDVEVKEPALSLDALREAEEAAREWRKLKKRRTKKMSTTRLVLLEGEPEKIEELVKSLGLALHGTIAVVPQNGTSKGAAKADAKAEKSEAKSEKGEKKEAKKEEKAAPKPSPKASPKKAPKKKDEDEEEEASDDEDDEEESDDEEEEEEEEEEEASDDEEEEDEEEEEEKPKAKKGGKKKGDVIDVSELEKAKRVSQVVQFFMEKGHKDPKDIVALCQEHKEEIPLLKRIADIPTRVRAAYDLIMSEAADEE